MSGREETLRHGSNEEISDQNVSREEERGEAGEPDAPTSGEENEGMNTILGAEPLTGVQDNESDE
jgi:hypothetical protein